MLGAHLDSTNLKPHSTTQDIIILCEQAAKYSMAAVCVTPYRLPLAKRILMGSGVKACTVIGFPLGADPAYLKWKQALWALENGADELDMVLNLGALKDRQWSVLKQELAGVMQLKRQFPMVLKAIVETGLLSCSELIEVLQLLEEQEVDYIKTSTGINCRGASLEDIHTICRHRRSQIKIKASGGIRTLDVAQQFIAAGADRIGSSNAAALVEAELEAADCRREG